jgi:hypothetical protein
LNVGLGGREPFAPRAEECAEETPLLVRGSHAWNYL